MTVLNITANNTQMTALKAFMMATKIKFEIIEEEQKSPYRRVFVEEIKQGDKDFAEGKGTKMSISEFKELCKLK